MSLSATFGNLTSSLIHPYNRCMKAFKHSWIVWVGRGVIGTVAGAASAIAIANLTYLPSFLEATSLCAPQIYAPWKNNVIAITSGGTNLAFAITVDTIAALFFCYQKGVGVNAIGKLSDRIKDWTESHTLKAIVGKGILVVSTAATTALAIANAVFFNQVQPLTSACRYNTLPGLANLVVVVSAESTPFLAGLAIFGTVVVLKIHHKTRPLPPPPLLSPETDV